MAELARAKVLIIGGGVTGTSVAKILEEMGSQISILDEKSSLVADSRFLTGDEALREKWDLAIVSPGWRPDHSLLKSLREIGVQLLSEVDLAWYLKSELRPHQKWLAITGTNGKTTTVEMTAAIIRAGGFLATACGNVGNTVVGAVVGDIDYEYLVLELSSFQLHWSDLPEYHASAILNIADDHSDWHGNFEKYAQAKMRILERSQLAILNGDDANVVEQTSGWTGRKVFYSLDAPKPGELGVVENLVVDRAFVPDTDEAEMIAELEDIQPTSRHNVSNTLAASGLALSAGIAYPVIRQTIQSFRPGRHRIELVGTWDGVGWVNDSKATNPHAAMASIMSFPSVIWIAGGLAKGASMHELVRQTAKKLRAVILIGKDRELIAEELVNNAGHVRIIRVDEVAGEDTSLMERVVTEAAKLAQNGDTVLLAPACASMDQFISYADRGDQFCQAVQKLVAR